MIYNDKVNKKFFKNGIEIISKTNFLSPFSKEFDISHKMIYNVK